MSEHFIIPFFIAGTIMFVVIIFFMTIFLILQNRRNNAYKIERQQLLFEQEQKVTNARFEEQEFVTNYISKEIHDNIGQALAILQMNMHMLSKDERGVARKPIMDSTNEVLNHVINTVHSLSHALNNDYLKGKGIFDALKKELEYINNSGAIKCSIHLNGNDPGLPNEKELLIYRIAQQAVHNAIKHSNATTLDVLINYTADRLTLTVIDNGIGFESQNTVLKGMGLENMRQRAKALSGNLVVRSTPGDGCTVLFSLNYDVAEIHHDDQISA